MPRFSFIPCLILGDCDSGNPALHPLHWSASPSWAGRIPSVPWGWLHTHSVICATQVLLIIQGRKPLDSGALVRWRAFTFIHRKKKPSVSNKTLPVRAEQTHAAVCLFSCLRETAFAKSNKPQSPGESIFVMWVRRVEEEHLIPLN